MHTFSRRGFVRSAVAGSLLMPGILSELLAADAADPLAPKKPHHAPKAKSVIFLFMEGGPSHLDLFDPKPALDKLAGKPMPESFGRPIKAMGTASNEIMPTQRKWMQHVQSGI